MRAVILCAMVALGVLGAPTMTYVSKCPGCEGIQAAAISPNGRAAVVAGSVAFGVVGVTDGTWAWNNTFVDFESEQEGPFAWAGDKYLVGLAPNGGTAQTVWAINPTTGAGSWSTFNDGSLTPVDLASTPNSFVTGVVNTTFVTRLDAQTGLVTWTYSTPGNVVQSVATGLIKTPGSSVSRWIDIAGAANTVYALEDIRGNLLWSDTTLTFQASSAAVDGGAVVAVVAGSADPNGANQGFTTVSAFDAFSGKPLWSSNHTNFAVQGISTFNGTTYLLGTNATIAFDSRTGTERWSAELANTQVLNIVAAAPGWYNGTSVLFASASGSDLRAIHAVTGIPLWTVSLPAGHTTAVPPLVSDKFVVVPTSTDQQSHGYVIGFNITA